REAAVEEAGGRRVGERLDAVGVAGARVAVVDRVPVEVGRDGERVTTGEVAAEVASGYGGDGVLAREEVEHLAAAPAVVGPYESGEPPLFLTGHRGFPPPGPGTRDRGRACAAPGGRIGGTRAPSGGGREGCDRPGTGRRRPRGTTGRSSA